MIRSAQRSILFALLLFSAVASGQMVVVDAVMVRQIPELRFTPDVEGKVLVSEQLVSGFEKYQLNEVPTVYNNWPLTWPGANEEGGVYGNLDNDPALELVYTIGNKIYAFNSNGTAVPGWPRTLDYPTDGSPAFGDIDGDGFGEIVVTTHQPSTFANGTIYAFEINGTDVVGFPVSTTGGALRSPALADLNGDGALEIIVTIRKHPEGFIHVYQGNGAMLSGWPQRLDYVPGSAAAVGDITGDNIPEIVTESYYGLHAFTNDGFLMPGFPYYPGTNRVFSYSTPVLADIDDDGIREIICGDHSLANSSGAIHIVRNDGTAYPGWPKLTSYWVYGPPSVGDINGDGLLDVIVGDQTLSATPLNKLYGWTAMTGDPLPGFPITGIWAVNSQVILADIDGDGMVELMFDDNTSVGKYQGYNHDGTPMDGWPLPVSGSTFYICPLVFDMDLNGGTDIAGAGYDQSTGNTKLYLWNAHAPMNDELAILPILQYNTRHNGVYGDYLMVGTPDQPIPEELRWYLYPNPAGKQLTVNGLSRAQRGSNGQQPVLSSGPEGSSVSISISDLSGRKISTITNKFLPVDLDISELPAGTYFLQVIDQEGQAGTLKFVRVKE